MAPSNSPQSTASVIGPERQSEQSATLQRALVSVLSVHVLADLVLATEGVNCKIEVSLEEA